MTSADTSRLNQRQQRIALSGTAATAVVATMIGMLFAGSTLVTPLYIMYKQAFGFTQISLGNLCGLLLFGRLSDQIGRKGVAAAGMMLMIIAALVFLSARGIGALYLGRILSGLAISVGAGTGTAWLAELIDDESKSRATVIATSANFIGLGVAALIAGVLAEYLPWPLHLPYIVYLLILAAVTLLVLMVPETVAQSRPSIRDLSIHPRVSVPPEIRTQFVAPAVTGFGAMALVGF
jgi:MFS family permease